MSSLTYHNPAAWHFDTLPNGYSIGWFLLNQFGQMVGERSSVGVTQENAHDFDIVAVYDDSLGAYSIVADSGPDTNASGYVAIEPQVLSIFSHPTSDNLNIAGYQPQNYDPLGNNAAPAIVTPPAPVIDKLSVRYRVRFWLADTAYKVFEDDEIDAFLWEAGYPGSGDDHYTQVQDVQIPLCPYHPLSNYWFAFWEDYHRPLYLNQSIKQYIYLAAAYGWDAISNSYALLAKISKTATFSKDTWTTAKAVNIRAVAMRLKATEEIGCVVVPASVPFLIPYNGRW